MPIAMLHILNATGYPASRQMLTPGVAYCLTGIKFAAVPVSVGASFFFAAIHGACNGH